MAYPNVVTCDKETFVRSKLDLDFFRLMETKKLKGMKKPGPVYEFNKSGLVLQILLKHRVQDAFGFAEMVQYVRHVCRGVCRQFSNNNAVKKMFCYESCQKQSQ